MDGCEDLLELLGRVDESVPFFELGVDEFAVHRHLEGAGRVGGGRTRALSLGKFGLDSILHLPVLGGVACAEERKKRGRASVTRRDDVNDEKKLCTPSTKEEEDKKKKERNKMEEGEGEGGGSRRPRRLYTSASAVTDVNLHHV